MEGFGHWDLVVWIVAAYIAVMALVQMMLHRLKTTHRRKHDQPYEPAVRAAAEIETDTRRDAA